MNHLKKYWVYTTEATVGGGYVRLSETPIEAYSLDDAEVLAHQKNGMNVFCVPVEEPNAQYSHLY